nr:hypothetical protein [Tabrizicola sp.]
MQSMVTIRAPLAPADVDRLRDEIGRELGNPASDAFRQVLEGASLRFLHFASLHALLGSDGREGHLVLEFSADG